MRTLICTACSISLMLAADVVPTTAPPAITSDVLPGDVLVGTLGSPISLTPDAGDVAVIQVTKRKRGEAATPYTARVMANVQVISGDRVRCDATNLSYDLKGQVMSMPITASVAALTGSWTMPIPQGAKQAFAQQLPSDDAKTAEAWRAHVLSFIKPVVEIPAGTTLQITILQTSMPYPEGAPAGVSGPLP